ncbi:unnamed protein product, partial [Effrenium voratum]
GYLLKQSDWLCTWKRRFVKLYTSGRLRCFNKDPGDQADLLVRPPWHRTLFIDENELNVTADVNVLGSRVYGHHLGAPCNTAQALPTFRLEIITPTGRYQFGMEEESVWRSWFRALHVLITQRIVRPPVAAISARKDNEEAIVTSSAPSRPGSSRSQSSSACCCEENLDVVLANDEAEKAEQRGKEEGKKEEKKEEQQEEELIEEREEKTEIAELKDDEEKEEEQKEEDDKDELEEQKE